jgi:hypothetical protein
VAQQPYAKIQRYSAVDRSLFRGEKILASQVNQQIGPLTSHFLLSPDDYVNSASILKYLSL